MKKNKIVFLLAFVFPLSILASIIHVPGEQPTIQAGIDAASDGDIVLVADGTYTGTGNRDIDFKGKAITVRSENGAVHCVIECQGHDSGPHRGFFFHNGEGPDSVVQGFTITGGLVNEINQYDNGAGIKCMNSSPTITGNIITDNLSTDPWNVSQAGGICLTNSSAIVINNIIEKNRASDAGGMYIAGSGSAVLINNTIVKNGQGGINCIGSSNTIIVNSIFWENYGYQILGSSAVTYSAIQGGYPGTGNTGADPLFAAGPHGNYYLSQMDAGQAENSPCVNTGDPASTMVGGTTRTDLAQDTGIVDMGYHYEAPESKPDTFIISGPEGAVSSPLLTFTFTGVDDLDPPSLLKYSYQIDNEAWTDYTYSNMATFNDLSEGPHTFMVQALDTGGNSDSTPAVRQFSVETWTSGGKWDSFVTGPGPGPTNPPLVRTSQAQWLAYGVAKYGVNVACGDLDTTGLDEVITGPGPGAAFGPHVRGWQVDGSPLAGASFLAYGTRKYGVNVAAGNIDDDMRDKIITGAGPGAVFGPHVRGWDYDGVAVLPVEGVNFMAYTTRRWGVNITCGDIDSDGYDEIITGAGLGAVFGPHVRGWDYDGTGMTTSIPGVNFMAYGTLRFGVNVACGYLEADGRDEIITGPGPGPSFNAHVRGWNYDEEQISPMPGVSYFAYESRYGAVISAGDVDMDSLDEILTVPGPGSDLFAHVRAWNADSGNVIPVETVNFIAYDSWITHGGSIAGGNVYGGSRHLKGHAPGLNMD